MKNIKIAKFSQRFLVMLVITCILFGDVMVARAQTTPVNSIPEGVEIEFSEEIVEEATEEVVEEIIAEEATEEAEVTIVEEEAILEEISEIEEESISAESEATDVVSGKYSDLNWSYSGGTLTITGSGGMHGAGASSYPWYEYQGAVKKVVIGDYVTCIGMGAFANMDHLTTVTIGSRVSTIYGQAFESCGALKSINIPASVKTIEYRAFDRCDHLQTVTFASNSKLELIGSYVFRECVNIKKMVFPASLKEIGESAFAGCINLTSVTFGNKLTTIDDCAFKDCLLLKNFTLPTSIRFIGKQAFSGCTSLTAIELPYGLKTIEKYAFENCTGLNGNIKISGTVTSLGTGIFIGCTGIDSAEIYSACAISDSMFNKCTSLATVKIGDSVTGIGSGAFAENTSLKTVSMGANITNIGYGAFNSCNSLTAINVPAATVSIGENAFLCCSSLSKVTFSVGLISIGSSAFQQSGITELKLPSTVVSIGESAFFMCESLKNVTLGSGVQSIEKSTFGYCKALTTVTMGNNIKSIGDNSFCKCESLATIIWPENLNTIGGYAFEDCDSLTTVQLPNSVTKIGNRSFASCNTLTKVVIGESVESISDFAFNSSPITEFTTYASDTVYSDAYIFGNTKNMTIYGWSDSTAKTYASEQGIAFKAISELGTATMKKITNVVSGVHVYWNEVPGAATYNVYRSTSKDSGYAVIKTGITASHFIDTTAISGKTYYYKVVAKHGTTESALSTVSIGITYVGTPDITSRINKGAGIQLGWNKISGATGYAIYRKPYEGSTWTRIKTISGNSTFTWTDESVKANNGTVYKYTVRALAGSDMKTLSGCRNTGRTMVRLSSRTLNSAVKASATSIKCNWTTSSAVTGYEVRFMVGNSVYRTYTVGNYKTGVKTFTGLPSGNTYKIQVRAYKKVDGVGSFYSAWSTAKTVSL